MGYYTRFHVEIKGEVNELEVMKKLEYINDCYFSDISKAFDSLDEAISEDEMKWYDHEDDMLQLSKYFPDVVFILSGEGEEKDDLWKAYFKDGKMEKVYAEIIYPEPSILFLT